MKPSVRDISLPSAQAADGWAQEAVVKGLFAGVEIL